MNNDDDRCTAMLEPGVRCTLPANHPGDEHEYVAALPPDVGKMLGQYIEELEAARRNYVKEYRRARTWSYISLALIVVYGTLMVAHIMRP